LSLCESCVNEVERRDAATVPDLSGAVEFDTGADEPLP